MNPNTSVYFSTVLENHRQLDRKASQGFAAEEATARHVQQMSTVTSTLKRLTSTAFDRPRQLVGGLAGLRRGAATPGIDILS